MVDQDRAAAYCSPTSVDMSTTSPKSRSTWITYICGSFIVHWLHFNPPGGNVASLYVHKKQAINIGNIKVNLEPIFGFILEINSIPNYLNGHTVVAMCFNMGHLVKKSGKNEAELEVSILT